MLRLTKACHLAAIHAVLLLLLGTDSTQAEPKASVCEALQLAYENAGCSDPPQDAPCEALRKVMEMFHCVTTTTAQPTTTTSVQEFSCLANGHQCRDQGLCLDGEVFAFFFDCPEGQGCCVSGLRLPQGNGNGRRLNEHSQSSNTNRTSDRRSNES